VRPALWSNVVEVLRSNEDAILREDLSVETWKPVLVDLDGQQEPTLQDAQKLLGCQRCP
jgi:hypothetical protein